MSEPTTGDLSTSLIPSFHLLCMDDRCITAFNTAKETYNLPDSVKVTIHNSRLTALSSFTRFEAIVSPANSYGRMDGGFDDALSRAFSPKGDYPALTRVAQAALYKEYRGFAPPGHCLLVGLDGEESLRKNSWGCKYLALCPTMAVPQNVKWDEQVVYECVWTLLAAIDRHNCHVREAASKVWERTGTEIQSVLMTPLATGTGFVTPEKWAAQTVIAIRHFTDAVENEEELKALEWPQITRRYEELRKTYGL